MRSLSYRYLILGSVSVAVFMAYYSKFEPQEEALLSMHDNYPTQRGSAVLSIVAQPLITAKDRSLLAPPESSTPSGIAPTSSLEDMDSGKHVYESPPAVRAFKRQRSQDSSATLAAEERAAAITELEAKINDAGLNKDFSASGRIVDDLRSMHIAPSELGSEFFDKLLALARTEVEQKSRTATDQLTRGCPEFASATMDSLAGLLQGDLGDRINTGDLKALTEQVAQASAPYSAAVLGAGWFIAWEDRLSHSGCV